MKITDKITITNECNMELMKRFPDKYFDLAIVDPPYGIGENWKKDKSSKFYKHNSSYKNNEIPDKEYFTELFRVSKNQIIWGANYYTRFLPENNAWIVWDKNRDYDKQHMAEGELAWSSFRVPLRIAPFLWNGACVCEPRYGAHPHEKPTLLYKWLLSKYAKQGYRILDTHLGSGSIAIACHDFGFELTACELDKGYYALAIERIKKHTAQGSLFAPEELFQPKELF